MSQPSDPSVPSAGLRQSTELGPGPDGFAHTKAAQDSTPPSGADDPVIGRVLSGLYHISERIGEGGMGAVYRAVHINLKKEFAIKVLVPDVTGRDVALERLRQEAVAASSIDHPNIVRVVNLDETQDGLLFIVMELLAGISLADRIEQNVLEPGEAIEIALQVCSALEATHARGIVHRDLKPDNIFLTKVHGETVVKVLDFGISKVKRDDAENVRVTKTGQLVGTPLYMSPEQAKGESDMDHRVDVYALGVLLYEMVAGEPPFTGKNYFQILWKHGNEEPPRPSSHDRARAIPHVLEEAILRALAKEPEERFESMQEFAEELKKARVAEARTSSRPASPRWLLVAGATLAGLGAAAWWASADDPAKVEAETEIAPVAPTIPETQVEPTMAVKPEPLEATSEAAASEAMAKESVPASPEKTVSPTLHFELHPSDAVVQMGNIVLQGPDSYELREYDPKLNEGRISLLVRRRGYHARKLAFDPRKEPNVKVRLKKLPKKNTGIFEDY